jgi:NADH-quinone oxidoreductase subunit G
VIALLAQELLQGATNLPKKVQKYFSSLDEGYLEAESNVGAEELSAMTTQFKRAKKKTFIIGNDVFAHPRAKEIAKLVGLIEKYSDYKVLIVPKDANTLGVSLVCELDKEESCEFVVGYNEKADFTISSMDDDADMLIPSLNQQEGTLTSIDKAVLPTNVALPFEGETLNDLASAFGISKRYTIDYTQELGAYDGFKDVAFDSLGNFLSELGEDIRGYKLENSDVSVNYTLEEVEELPEYNGTVIYHANPVLQFNKYTAKTSELPKEAQLRGSQQFAVAAKIQDGDTVRITFGGMQVTREFKIDENLKGTVAINPTFDFPVNANRYRFEKSKIERVQS